MMNAEDKKKKKFSITMTPDVRRAIKKDWNPKKFFSLTFKDKKKSKV